MLLIFVAFVLFKQKGKKTVLETYTQSPGRYFCMLLSPILMLPVKGIDAFLPWHAILHRTGHVIHKSNDRLPREVFYNQGSFSRKEGELGPGLSGFQCDGCGRLCASLIGRSSPTDELICDKNSVALRAQSTTEVPRKQTAGLCLPRWKCPQPRGGGSPPSTTTVATKPVKPRFTYTSQPDSQEVGWCSTTFSCSCRFRQCAR